MTQEEKFLLLQDLCCRLLYNVMVDYESHVYLNEIDPACKDIGYITVRIQDVERLMCAKSVMIENIKPYLRPMSSMTEEERYEFECYIPSCYWEKIGVEKEDTGIGFIPICEFFDNDKGIKNLYNVLDIRPIDWLNKKMFDFRGLIPKDLAWTAPEGMYNVNI